MSRRQAALALLAVALVFLAFSQWEWAADFGETAGNLVMIWLGYRFLRGDRLVPRDAPNGAALD